MQLVEQPLLQIELQCSICYDKSRKPVQCKGACHKLFCLKCAAVAKTYSDRCPNRCSAPFQVEILTSTRFFCPFRPEQCTLIISSQNELDSHHQVCPHISNEQLEKLTYRQNYLCNQGHPLTFLTKASLQILYGKKIYKTSDKCSQCQQVESSRAICISCSLKTSLELYCSNCRPHPCSKSLCPLGHKLKHRLKPAKLRHCDFCDVPAGLLGKKVHGFCPCDFDICDLCYQKLPEKRQRIAKKVNPEKIWQLSLLNDQESSDGDWKQ